MTREFKQSQMKPSVLLSVLEKLSKYNLEKIFNVDIVEITENDITLVIEPKMTGNSNWNNWIEQEEENTEEL